MTGPRSTDSTRPTRRERHSPRWTWDADICVARLQEWAAQTGRPPRAYEWALNQPTLRSMGLPVEGRARWEAAYPRFPSAGAVTHHHGTFGAALLAAGLEVYREPLRLPLQQRVDSARQMIGEGVDPRDIADELGVKPATVAAYSAAASCGTCGAWVITRRGPDVRCSPCRGREKPDPEWTVPEIVSAIREWISEVGAAPTSEHWRARGGHPTWVAAWPRWPTAAVVVRRVGSWEEALRLSGYVSTDREVLLERLRSFFQEHGRAPRWSGEINRRTLGGSSLAFVEEFGSWRAALAAAGIETSPTWDRETLISEAHRWADSHNGHGPRQRDWASAVDGFPQSNSVLRHFGSWDAYLATAGLAPPPAPEWTRERLLEARDRWIRDNGRAPVRDDWRHKDVGRPAGTTVYTIFPSWSEFLAAESSP